MRSDQFALLSFSCIVVLTTETNILEQDDSSSQSHDWLLFSVDEFRYLNGARVGLSTAYSDFDCTLKCLRNPLCLSINLAASKDVNGKLWCELLSSDRYRNTLHYRENMTSHHFFLLDLVGSVLDAAILLDYISKIIVAKIIILVKPSGCSTAEPSNNNRIMRKISDRTEGLKSKDW